MPIHNAIQYPVDKIRQWIQDDWTQAQIADELSRTLDPRITAKLIYKVCKKHGIKCQRTGPRSGPGHPEWKGGRIYSKDGYVMVWSPDHPTTHKTKKYVLEHRLVMEKHLGRYLTRLEVVHHKNGVKDDNRIENLQLFETNGKHLEETLKGCVPNWTDDGKRRIREAKREKTRLIGRIRGTIQRELKLNAFPNRKTIDHYLAQLGISLEQACEMVDTLGSLPPLPRPMPQQRSLP